MSFVKQLREVQGNTVPVSHHGVHHVAAALTTSSVAVEKIMHEAAMVTAKLTKSELEAAVEQVIRQARETRQAALINLASSYLTITAIAFAVYALK